MKTETMMGALVCDICGGKLTMQAGGIAVCNVCGINKSYKEDNQDNQQEKLEIIVQ